MGADCIFISTIPYYQLSNTSAMPKIVPIDNRTVLVDTKNVIIYQLVDQKTQKTWFYTNW